MLHGQAECVHGGWGRKEDESRRVFVPVLTVFSVLWIMHKVAVVWGGGSCLGSGCGSVVVAGLPLLCSWHPCSALETFCTSYTVVLFLSFFFNAPLALVKWLRTGLMSTFRTLSIFPWALVTARYFHLCQPYQRFKSMLTNRTFATWSFFFTIFKNCYINRDSPPKILASKWNQQIWLACGAVSNTFSSVFRFILWNPVSKSSSFGQLSLVLSGHHLLIFSSLHRHMLWC